MKRLQIRSDEDLDADLAPQASRPGRSNGALVRDALRRQMKLEPSIGRDPIFDLGGPASFEPVAPEEIDDLVYRVIFVDSSGKMTTHRMTAGFRSPS